MAKIIISENQFNLLTKKLMSEAVGVPDYILDSGEKLYDIVSNYLKRINRKEDNYKGFITTQLPVGDMVFETIMLDVRVNELEGYDGETVLASAAVGNAFRFDNAILMQVNKKDMQIDLQLNFIVSENWEDWKIILIFDYQFKTIHHEKTFYYYDDYLLGWYGNVFGWAFHNCYQQ